jgi:hypothetical protein
MAIFFDSLLKNEGYATKTANYCSAATAAVLISCSIIEDCKWGTSAGELKGQ